jgi:predicted RecA/RadA family phage recombinase
MGEATLAYEAGIVKFTAAANLTSGEILQLPDGRAAVVKGLKAILSGEEAVGQTLGVFDIASATGTTFSAGDAVWWDTSASAAVPFASADIAEDFPLGSALVAKVSGQLVVRVDLNAGINEADSPILASLAINDGGDVALGTTTGTKIGTAVTQKLGFWNVTPIVQPAAAAQAAISATLTDSTGDSGTHDDTLADGLTSVAPAAYSAHASGAVAVTSNAATDLDTTAAAVANLRSVVATLVTDVTVQNQNDSDMAQKIIELVALVNAMRTALVNSGIMKGAA